MTKSVPNRSREGNIFRIVANKFGTLPNADLILFPEVQLTEFFPQYEGQDAASFYMQTLIFRIRLRSGETDHTRISDDQNYIGDK